MKTYLAAVALAAALAQPAAAVTFPTLTTIYVGSGVYDNGGPDNQGIATSIFCSNVSGVSVQVRALVLGRLAELEGSLTTTLVHGETFTFSTHGNLLFFDNNNLETGGVVGGVVNVEATNSAVFCTAAVIDAENLKPVFSMPLHLVRVNPHPGTVE